MKTKQILKKVKKIEVKTNHIVDNLIYGAYHSVFKGRGIEFSEVREYQIDDDPRSIDWNVTARMNHPYVKEYIEERDLTILIVFDISGSSDFGTQLALKKDIGIELSASLAFSAQRSNDRVGLFLTTNKVEKYLPPRKGRKHILRVIREMIYFTPRERTTNLGVPLEFINKVIKKKSIIFIISDFQDSMDNFKKPLSVLRNKHDVVAVRLWDLRELEMPDIGLVELEDEETGEQILVDTSDPEFRKNYSKLVELQKNELKSFMNQQKIDLVDISTSEDWTIPLIKFFKKRERYKLI
ncbi:MAG: DUF58 domain-containing protein [Methanosarcinales archaeon]